MVDDPKIEVAEPETIYNKHLCSCVYNSLEGIDFDFCLV